MGNPEIQAFLNHLAVLNRMSGVTKLMSNFSTAPACA
jgi:hypothetical protein